MIMEEGKSKMATRDFIVLYEQKTPWYRRKSTVKCALANFPCKYKTLASEVHLCFFRSFSAALSCQMYTLLPFSKSLIAF